MVMLREFYLFIFLKQYCFHHINETMHSPLVCIYLEEKKPHLRRPISSRLSDLQIPRTQFHYWRGSGYVSKLLIYQLSPDPASIPIGGFDLETDFSAFILLPIIMMIG